MTAHDTVAFHGLGDRGRQIDDDVALAEVEIQRRQPVERSRKLAQPLADRHVERGERLRSDAAGLLEPVPLLEPPHRRRQRLVVDVARSLVGGQIVGEREPAAQQLDFGALGARAQAWRSPAASASRRALRAPNSSAGQPRFVVRCPRRRSDRARSKPRPCWRPASPPSAAAAWAWPPAWSGRRQFRQRTSQQEAQPAQGKLLLARRVPLGAPPRSRAATRLRDCRSVHVKRLRKSRRPPFLAGGRNPSHGARMWPADGGKPKDFRPLALPAGAVVPLRPIAGREAPQRWPAGSERRPRCRPDAARAPP